MSRAGLGKVRVCLGCHGVGGLATTGLWPTQRSVQGELRKSALLKRVDACCVLCACVVCVGYWVYVCGVCVGSSVKKPF